MIDQIENEIQNDLFKDKLKKYYIKYRIYIIFFVLILIFGPLIYQLNNFLIEKKNQKNLEQYSQAVLLIQNKKDSEAIAILDRLKRSDNLVTQILSTNTLLEYYFHKKDTQKVIQEINFAYNNIKNKDELLTEILSLKKALISFEKITESEILELLKPNFKNKIFNSISNKILHDYYIMKNQNEKAKLFLKN